MYNMNKKTDKNIFIMQGMTEEWLIQWLEACEKRA